MAKWNETKEIWCKKDVFELKFSWGMRVPAKLTQQLLSDGAERNMTNILRDPHILYYSFTNI